jgi:hypothetical protein
MEMLKFLVGGALVGTIGVPLIHAIILSQQVAKTKVLLQGSDQIKLDGSTEALKIITARTAETASKLPTWFLFAGAAIIASVIAIAMMEEIDNNHVVATAYSAVMAFLLVRVWTPAGNLPWQVITNCSIAAWHLQHLVNLSITEIENMQHEVEALNDIQKMIELVERAAKLADHVTRARQQIAQLNTTAQATARYL